MKDSFELKLVGYSDTAARGFVIPVYGTGFYANTLYTAICWPSGDHNGTISEFDEFSSDGVLPIHHKSDQKIPIGSKWIDVFLWDGEVFSGTPKEIWNEIQPNLKLYKQEAPLIILDLATYAGVESINDYIRASMRFVRRRFGQVQANEWVASIIRRDVVLALQRFAAKETVSFLSAEIESLVDINIVAENDFLIDLSGVLSSVAKEVDFIRSSRFLDSVRRSLMVNIFMEKEKVEGADDVRAYYKLTRLAQQEELFKDHDFATVYKQTVSHLKDYIFSYDEPIPDFEELCSDVASDILLDLYSAESYILNKDDLIGTILPAARKMLRDRVSQNTRQNKKRTSTNKELKAISEQFWHNDMLDLREVQNLKELFSQDAMMVRLIELLASGNTDAREITKSMKITTRGLSMLRSRLRRALEVAGKI